MTTTIGIWHIIGWSVGALAALTLIVALLGDAARRRFRRVRRCPKCWYDLSHTPGMTCSECGYTARREKQLFKSRRRKRWVLVTILLWLGSYFAFRTPDIQQRGWVAAVPTTALIFLWQREGVDTLLASVASAVALRADTLAEFAHAPLSAELFRRVESDDLAAWQWRLLVEAALHSSAQPILGADDAYPESLGQGVLMKAKAEGHLTSPELLRRALGAGSLRVMTRRQWPVGEPIYACLWTNTIDGRLAPRESLISLRIALAVTGLHELTDRDLSLAPPTERTPNRFKGSPGTFLSGQCDLWRDAAVLLGRSDVQLGRVDYRIIAQRNLDSHSRKVLGVGYLQIDTSQSFGFSVAGAIDEVLTPVRNPEFDAALTERWQPELHLNHLKLNLDGLADVFALLDGATFAVNLEVRDGDVALATAQAWWCIARARGRSGAPVIIPEDECVELTRLTEPLPPPSSDRCTLRITSDPHMALRRFGSDRYWEGSLEIPLSGRWRSK